MENVLIRMTPEMEKIHKGAKYILLDKDGDKAFDDREMIGVDIKGEKATRTILQNKAMRKYWDIMINLLNDAGWSKKKYYAVKEVDVDWTPDSFGEDVWRGIQEAMYQHRKTSKLETDQVSKVYDVVNAHIAKTCGVSADFPSRDTLINMALGRK